MDEEGKAFPSESYLLWLLLYYKPYYLLQLHLLRCYQGSTRSKAQNMTTFLPIGKTPNPLANLPFKLTLPQRGKNRRENLIFSFAASSESPLFSLMAFIDVASFLCLFYCGNIV